MHWRGFRRVAIGRAARSVCLPELGRDMLASTYQPGLEPGLPSHPTSLNEPELNRPFLDAPTIRCSDERPDNNGVHLTSLPFSCLVNVRSESDSERWQYRNQSPSYRVTLG